MHNICLDSLMVKPPLPLTKFQSSNFPPKYQGSMSLIYAKEINYGTIK